MLRAFLAVAVRLADGSFEPVKPEVVVGGLIRFGKTWELSVPRIHIVLDLI